MTGSSAPALPVPTVSQWPHHGKGAPLCPLTFQLGLPAHSGRWHMGRSDKRSVLNLDFTRPHCVSACPLAPESSA